MGSRDGRARLRRDFPSRSDDKSHQGRGNNPPSRHLWVGNLSQNLTENELAHHFLQFGKLESVAFQPGRSYAFINYKNDEDAFAAIKVLQEYIVDGNQMRIEFAKADKSLSAPRDTEYSERWDEPPPMARGSPFCSRDPRALESRTHNSSPVLPYSNKSKMNDKDAEPSEVLWIGFPAQLKVDEFILRKAFSPFGEIEKITAFPGRTYAFVRFRTVMASRRAKETLQGKLFGNPRVHICFANSDSGTPNRERNSKNTPSSPRMESYGRAGSSEHFRVDRNFGGTPDRRIGSPPRNMDHGDGYDFSRHTNLWRGRNDDREQRRFPGQGSEYRLPGNLYEGPHSPPNNRGDALRDFSPQKFPQRGAFYDDPWDLPEDPSILHGAKKVKTNSFPQENELPEYPFPELEKVNRVFPHDIPHSGSRGSRSFEYRMIPDHSLNGSLPLNERGDHWNGAIDKFQGGSIPPPSSDMRRLTPDVRKPSANEVWKWEGMIVKGGSSVCRARCFPVGKPLDMGLPEYLDCTARTSLDMLAKHYYQAASVWVVFFVPANDPDIPYYNEFMNYLAEKQRAAVAKLDERTTLFLVPPSEFSEKVLRVPGKLSISGVILRLDPDGSDNGLPPQNEHRDSSFFSNQGDEAYQKTMSHPRPYIPNIPSANYEKPGVHVDHIPGNLSAGSMQSTYAIAAQSVGNIQSVHAQGQDYAGKLAGIPNWTPNDMQQPNPGFNNSSSAYVNSSNSTGTLSQMHRQVREAAHNNYTNELSGISSSGNTRIPPQEKPPISSSIPGPSFPPELAQIPSSHLHRGQYSGASTAGEYKPPGNINQSAYTYTQHHYVMPNDQMPSEHLSSQYDPAQQLQLQPSPNFLVPPQKEFPAANQDNQQLPSAGQDDAEADPQKRLQVTLQLAAALLQQIQQGKGT